MVLYLTRSHSFIRFRGYETAVWLPNKRSGREVQPLAALYPTVRLSPWRQVRKNIHSRVWTPRSHLICTPPRRATPPGSPQFLYWGTWASPLETDQDSRPGWLPPVPLDFVSPRRASLLVPLSLDLSASLPPEFCLLPFVCFLCGTDIKHLYENIANWKSLLSHE